MTELCDRVFTALLPARLLGDVYYFVPAWIPRLYFMSTPGTARGDLLSSPGLSIPAGNPEVLNTKAVLIKVVLNPNQMFFFKTWVTRLFKILHIIYRWCFL